LYADAAIAARFAATYYCALMKLCDERRRTFPISRVYPPPRRPCHPSAHASTPSASAPRCGRVIIVEPSRVIVVERRGARANNKLRAIDARAGTLDARDALEFFPFDGAFNASASGESALNSPIKNRRRPV